VKINFHRVLLGFFENWDKSPQKKWDKGGADAGVDAKHQIVILYFFIRNRVAIPSRNHGEKRSSNEIYA
jgi:hypothetical protein